MDHDMQGMAGMTAMEHAPGTFAGHVIPGVMLLVWATLWVVELWRSRGARRPDAPLEALGFVPPIKVILPLIGVGIEWPGPGWDPIDRVMNFQHVSMYGFFALSGVVDLLERKGVVPRGATFVAFAGACVNAGGLFLAHGGSGGVSGTVHFLLALSFFATGACGIGEWILPRLGFHWLRLGAMLTVGSWFLQIAWMLFRSGWDLMDPIVQMRSSLLFSWNVLGVAVLLLAFRLLRLGAPGTVTAPAGARPQGSI